MRRFELALPGSAAEQSEAGDKHERKEVRAQPRIMADDLYTTGGIAGKLFWDQFETHKVTLSVSMMLDLACQPAGAFPATCD
jgi:hypothetical protein